MTDIKVWDNRIIKKDLILHFLDIQFSVTKKKQMCYLHKYVISSPVQHWGLWTVPEYPEVRHC